MANDRSLSLLRAFSPLFYFSLFLFPALKESVKRRRTRRRGAGRGALPCWEIEGPAVMYLRSPRAPKRIPLCPYYLFIQVDSHPPPLPPLPGASILLLNVSRQRVYYLPGIYISMAKSDPSVYRDIRFRPCCSIHRRTSVHRSFFLNPYKVYVTYSA